jgi:hypothetical protein
MRWVVKSIPYSLSHHYSLYIYVFLLLYLFLENKNKKIFLIKLYLILKSLITIPLQSLRFDTLNIAYPTRICPIASGNFIIDIFW